MTKRTVSHYSIIVIGGGLAGVCAAIAAAREFQRLDIKGKVALINDRPVLGGVSSSEIRVPPIGAGRNPWGFETGIISELMYEERARNHNRWEMGTANSIWDIILWEKVKAEQNIDLFLNTSVRKVTTQQLNSKIKINTIEAFQLGNEKEFEMSSEIFIDCSGDSVVAYEAGAEIISGRESKSQFNESLALDVADSACMGSSLLFQAKDMGRPCPFTPPPYAAKYTTENSLYFRPHSNFKNGYYWIEVGAPFHTIDQNEEIRDELLRHVLGVWDHLKNHCTHFGKSIENWALDWVGMIPGKRSSRRILGDTIITENDLRSMRLFEDRVAFGGHFFDLHTIGGILANDKPGNPVDIDPDLWDKCRLKPYPIPFSALYSTNISNLMMAGRNISTSHIANGSTRVMLTNALLGQAVGSAAAICIQKNVLPKNIYQNHIATLQQNLLRQGSTLHGLKNEDSNDLAKIATITASDHAPLDLSVIENESTEWQNFKHKLEFNLGCVIPVSESYLKSVSLFLESAENYDIKINLQIFKLNHIWDIQSNKKCLKQTSAILKSNFKGYLEFDLQLDTEKNHFYFITIEAVKAQVFWRFRRNHPTGVFSVFQSNTSGFWKYLRHQRVEGFETFCLQTSPIQYPFNPENIISGETRPFHFTNIWRFRISDEKAPWVQLQWNKPIKISQIEITFDTDLSLTNETMPAFYKSPNCIQDYKIFATNETNQTTEILKITGNYQRKQNHALEVQSIKSLKIQFLKSNGADICGIYEIRIY